MRKINFHEDEYYHVYNRGTDKRTIFLEEREYERFLYLLYACNDVNPLLNSQFYYRGFASIVTQMDTRKKLVNILCFCLMPNHYHLLLQQRVKGGISRFMQKLGTGYTMYFNTKHKRNGVLFQGVFKGIHVEDERYLTHLTRYIHLNPLELKKPDWKKIGVKNWEATEEYLKIFPWSSYSDYTGDNRFKPILDKELMMKIFKTPKEYGDFMKSWIPNDLKQIESHILL